MKAILPQKTWQKACVSKSIVYEITVKSAPLIPIEELENYYFYGIGAIAVFVFLAAILMFFVWLLGHYLQNYGVK